MTDVYILSAARTAIGGFGGSLAALSPIDLATHAAQAAIARAGVEAGQIGTSVFGHVLNTEPRDMYLSRVAAMQAGIPETVPAMNVNRLCGSGAQAVVSAVQSLLLGDAGFALAGGAEAMSRAPYILPAARFGQKMGDALAIDMMTGALTCPFGTGHMGITAENVAAEGGISRADQDAFALESQTRAARAIAEGRFVDQIAPIEIASRKLRYRREADGIIWFEFSELCETMRSQYDYMELSKIYHTLLLSGVKQMGQGNDDVARRFIALVDEFYERHVKLIISAAVPMEQLYTEGILSFEFKRCLSRLQEMQSHDYLAREHLP